MLRILSLLLVCATLAFGAAPVAAATVKVSVNGVGITDFQIAQRVKLFALEGRNNGSKGATEELINEALQLQEAKRLGIGVTEADVDSAVINVARSVKLSNDKLKEVLAANGVGIETLRDRLRASIAWNRVVDEAVTAQVKFSDLELDQQAAAELTAANSYDYILKEVIFLATSGAPSGRTGEANRYRKSFAGCDGAVQLSQSYRDAAVIDVGRRHATQMPEAIAKELAGLNPGGITKPRVIESGVSMLAVCAKEAARDTTFVKGQIRQKQGSELLKAEAEKYLGNLRKKASISYN